MVDFQTVRDTVMIPCHHGKVVSAMEFLEQRCKADAGVADYVGKCGYWGVFQELAIEMLRNYIGEEECGIHPESCDLAENMEHLKFERLQEWAYDVFFCKTVRE